MFVSLRVDHYHMLMLYPWFFKLFWLFLCKYITLFIIILITDNFVIQVNNLLTPIISVYKSFKTKLIRISYSLQYCLILNYLIKLSLNLVLQHGDIETNLGPRGKHSQHFSFCHWYLNSLPAHNYAKVPLLQVFNTLHKFNLI